MDDLKEAYNEIDNASGQIGEQDAKTVPKLRCAEARNEKLMAEFKESIGKHILPDLTSDIDQTERHYIMK